jgi:threonine dehydratase
VPWGGGGLACGIAAAVARKRPECRVFAAEVATAAPLSAALAAGEPRTVAYQPSFVDGIGSKVVFASMLERARGLALGALVAPLDDVKSAVRLLAERNRVVAEGAGACAVACALAGGAGSGPIVCIVSGGNIDLDRFASLIAPSA